MRRVMFVMGMLAAGCAEGTEPPWVELPLRDVLLADPATLETLSIDARTELAERFERARRDDVVVSTLPPIGAVEVPAAVAVLDEARAEEGRDALVALEVRSDVVIEVRTVSALGSADGGVPVALDREALRWDVEPEGTMAAAVHGRAGTIVAEVAALTGATTAHLEPGMRAALVSDGEVVRVSAQWLVVMAALEPVEVAAPPPSTPPSGGVGVATAELLSGSPYSLASLAECTADVTGRCATCLGGGSCRGSPTLRDFSSVRAECEFLAADSRRAESLCALGMLSVTSVASCVRRIATCPMVPLDRSGVSLDYAAAFLADPSCRTALDRCAADRTPPRDCSASCDPDCGLSCSDTFSGCSACADATTSTASSCSDTCDSTTSACDSRCDRCEARGAGRSSPLGGAAVCLPVVVALVLARRRVRK